MIQSMSLKCENYLLKESQWLGFKSTSPHEILLTDCVFVGFAVLDSFCVHLKLCPLVCSVTAKRCFSMFGLDSCLELLTWAFETSLFVFLSIGNIWVAFTLVSKTQSTWSDVKDLYILCVCVVFINWSWNEDNSIRLVGLQLQRPTFSSGLTVGSLYVSGSLHPQQMSFFPLPPPSF